MFRAENTTIFNAHLLKFAISNTRIVISVLDEVFGKH